MVLMTIILKILLAIRLSLGLHKGRPSYRRRTSSTSELSFKKFFLLYILWVILPYWIQIRGSPHSEPNINLSVQMTSWKCRKLKLEYLAKITYFLCVTI